MPDSEFRISQGVSTVKSPLSSITIRVLYVATVAVHIRTLHLHWLDHIGSRGFEIVGVASDIESCFDCAARCIAVHNVPFSRNPFSLQQIIQSGTSLRRLARLYSVDLIHVQTPVAGFLTRVAFRKAFSQNRIGMVYTAHGLHFYSGGPRAPNLLYRALERWAAKVTHSLCLVNSEDVQAMRAFKLSEHGRVFYVPGNGVELSKFTRGSFSPLDIESFRRSLGVGPGEYMGLMVAEFIKRKRHGDLVRALTLLPHLKVIAVFAGEGRLFESVRGLATQLGVESRCRFLGFRKDIARLMASSDLLWLPSQQEGLPACVMEAMAMGLPIVGADTRGTRDLISHGCGKVHAVGDVAGIAQLTEELLSTPGAATNLGAKGRARIAECYSAPVVFSALESAYGHALRCVGKAQ
jgi:glycosyltransferase involved in cell wall biosynthesis